MTTAPIPDTLKSLKVPVDGLVPYGANPRRGNVDVIVDSLGQHGQYRPIVVRAKTFEVLAGNHTLAAAKVLGWDEIAATFVDVTDDEAARIVLVDNRSSDLGSYDDAELVSLLGSLEGLDGTGYEDNDLSALHAATLEGDERAATTGELLSIADVSWGEPHHQVALHETWKLGRHILVVAHVQLEHPLWVTHLSDGVVFCPYPEPYITGSVIAATAPLLLVQPNRYLAGHLLDKHAALFPNELVELAS